MNSTYGKSRYRTLNIFPLLEARGMGEGPFPIAESSVERTNRLRGLNLFALRSQRHFQVLTEENDELELNPPVREYECKNYEICLGLAAALNWKSFTCQQCSGDVNQQLLWRAHHKVRNNPSLSKLCGLPMLSASERCDEELPDE